MSVAAVIVTYNRRDRLRQCLDAVIGQTGSAVPDVIVVDNNSTDGTGEMVASYAEDAGIELTDRTEGIGGSRRIVYLRQLYNSGGAGGFAHGIRNAVEAGYDYVWLMDDDCVPAEDALEELLKYDREQPGRYGFLSSRVLWKDGSLCEMNVQRETVFRDLSADRLSEGSVPSEVSMASFVSILIPARIVYDLGLPIRKFFTWTDDWEYTRRISLRYPCAVVPSSKAVHHCDKNTGADISTADEKRIERFRYLYRNDVYLYRREGLKGLCYEAARLALHSVRVLSGDYPAGEKLRRLGIIYRGTIEGIGFFPEYDRVGRKS